MVVKLIQTDVCATVPQALARIFRCPGALKILFVVWTITLWKTARARPLPSMRFVPPARNPRRGCAPHPLPPTTVCQSLLDTRLESSIVWLPQTRHAPGVFSDPEFS